MSEYLKSPNVEKPEKRVVAIGGDGIGPGIVKAAVNLLNGMNISGLKIDIMPAGESAIETHGVPFPPETKKAIDNCDAILFGATEEKALQVIAYLRWGLLNFANVRPIKYFKGMHTNLKEEFVQGVDYAFVREGTEGMYAAAGKEGSVRKLFKKGIVNQTEFDKWGPKAKYAMRIVSPAATERIARVACEICMKRKKLGKGRGLLEIVCKPNVLRVQDKLWIDIIRKVAEEYPEITVEQYIVDDFARRLLRYPDYHDTIVIPNMMGDILSDESAEIVGGLGVAGSGVYGPKSAYFEPTHGSAPAVLARKNYKGEPVANPTAQIISAAMMLEYLGYDEESRKLEKAIDNYFLLGLDLETNWSKMPRDGVTKKYQKEGKFASTDEVAKNILEEYKKL